MSSLGPCGGLRTCLRRGPPHVQSGALSGSEDLSQGRTPTCPVWGLVGVRGPVSGEDPHMSSLGPCRGPRTCLRRGAPHVQSGALSGSEDLSQERTPTCPVWGLVGVRGPVSGEDPHMSSLGPCRGPRTCLRRGPPHVQSGALWGSEDLSQERTPTCPVWGLVGVRGPVSGEDPHMSSLGPCGGLRTCLRRGPPHVQSGALSGSEDLSQGRTPTCPVWGLVGVRGPVSGEDPHMSSLGPCRGPRTCLRRGPPHVQSGALSGSEDLSQERTPTCPVWGLVGV